ncbi:PepT family domain protein [Bordetella holmesii ATCC 51541]|nr:PepT family domain protein [Bordetella holmesii ATCC 51541]EWM46136.1 PepT family domain protein [Bordetella holmesii 35009]
MSTPVLELRQLRTEFRIGGAWHAAVRDVSLTVAPNETLAVVGESGSGKSVTALSVLRLLPTSGARHAGGQILLEGQDIASLPEKQMMRLRGDAIAMIFQEPMTSLNPTMTVGGQIAEAIRQHRKLSWAEARKLALEALQEVKIPAAEKRFDAYPHQFSGGCASVS